MELLDELLEHILIIITPNDLINMSKVSHKFKNLTNQILAHSAFYNFNHDLNRFKLFTEAIENYSFGDLINHSNDIIRIMAFRIITLCDRVKSKIYLNINIKFNYYRYLHLEVNH